MNKYDFILLIIMFIFAIIFAGTGKPGWLILSFITVLVLSWRHLITRNDPEG